MGWHDLDLGQMTSGQGYGVMAHSQVNTNSFANYVLFKIKG